VLLTAGLLAFSLAAPGAASVAGVTVTGPTAPTWTRPRPNSVAQKWSASFPCTGATLPGPTFP